MDATDEEAGGKAGQAAADTLTALDNLDTPAGRTGAAAGAITLSHTKDGATAAGRKVAGAREAIHPTTTTMATAAASPAAAAGVETVTPMTDVEQEASSSTTRAEAAPHIQPPRGSVKDGGEAPLPGEDTQPYTEKDGTDTGSQGAAALEELEPPVEAPGDATMAEP